MKYCLFVLFSAGIACAQSSDTRSASTLFTVDISGHVVTDAEYLAHNGDKAQLNQSVNGRDVPVQSSEVHVLTDTPNHRVIETIVQKFDPTGRPTTKERTVTDETKTTAGSTLRATTYQTNLSGDMVESERRVVDSQVHGGVTTSDIDISRPGINSSFETAEKRKVVTTVEGNTSRSTEDIERPSGNGNQFFAAARVVTEETKVEGKTTLSTALYEPNYLGTMALSRQDVSTTTKAGSGSVTTLDTYAQNIYGVASEAQSGPKLREQQTIVREEKNGVVTETTSVSRPTTQDPNRLGTPTVISTLVCTGTCKDAYLKAPAPTPAPASKP